MTQKSTRSGRAVKDAKAAPSRTAAAGAAPKRRRGRPTRQETKQREAEYARFEGERVIHRYGNRRFYDLEGGHIRIDGQDIAGVTQESLRRSIGMVTQDSSLLHRSVRENIEYGKPGASDAEIVVLAAPLSVQLPAGTAFGTMVALRGERIERVPIGDAVRELLRGRLVEQGFLLSAARSQRAALGGRRRPVA